MPCCCSPGLPSILSICLSHLPGALPLRPSLRCRTTQRAEWGTTRRGDARERKRRRNPGADDSGVCVGLSVLFDSLLMAAPLPPAPLRPPPSLHSRRCGCCAIHTLSSLFTESSAFCCCTAAAGLCSLSPSVCLSQRSEALVCFAMAIVCLLRLRPVQEKQTTQTEARELHGSMLRWLSWPGLDWPGLAWLGLARSMAAGPRWGGWHGPAEGGA